MYSGLESFFFYPLLHVKAFLTLFTIKNVRMLWFAQLNKPCTCFLSFNKDPSLSHSIGKCEDLPIIHFVLFDLVVKIL